jgi:hypothetical protein
MAIEHKRQGEAVPHSPQGPYFAKIHVSHHQHAEKGLPGYHDPTAGIGGSSQTVSALTLRLVLSGVGFVMWTAAAVVLAIRNAPVALVAVVTVLAVISIADFVVVAQRKRRGEPG